MEWLDGRKEEPCPDIREEFSGDVWLVGDRRFGLHLEDARSDQNPSAIVADSPQFDKRPEPQTTSTDGVAQRCSWLVDRKRGKDL